jgi:hypothetical protein
LGEGINAGVIWPMKKETIVHAFRGVIMQEGQPRAFR